ncbi:MAG: type II toxin-antitoxin system HipA family toxin [Polaromonas sp.]|nr:type II toxin-antitoxin system HipA family toxin [Polaromonas sp.]
MTTRPAKTRPATYKKVDVVNVHLWGKHVGAVALDPTWGYYVFEYTPAFASLGVEPAPLQMPVRQGGTFMFTDLPEITFKRLPAMLADTLPDDFGNALIDRYMADRGLDKSKVTALDRLAYMGNRAMGALEYKPTRSPPRHKPSAIVLGELVAQARRAVEGTLEDDTHADAALRSILDVGTSAGGARAKAVIAWNAATQEIRAGQLDAPDGFEHWLLKFDGMGRDNELGSGTDYGRIEYAYHLMAEKAGIDMSPCRLLEENGRAHFMTRRFDRGPANTRHHMQTLCAMNHLDYKKKGTNSYEQLFVTMDKLSLPYEQKEEAYRRMVFNVVGKNCDDHTKNISFRLRQGQPWELAPAYDISFAHNPRGEWTHQHLMSINGRFKDFARADLLELASRFGIGSAAMVIEQVVGSIALWPIFAAQAGVPKEVMDNIAGFHLLGLGKA